jgi:hypothetical protein
MGELAGDFHRYITGKTPFLSGAGMSGQENSTGRSEAQSSQSLSEKSEMDGGEGFWPCNWVQRHAGRGEA